MAALSHRLSQLAFAGLLAWGALLFVRLGVEAGPAEEAAHLILLAPLALVPLYLDATLPASFAPAPRALTVLSWALGPAAWLAGASFLLAPGLEAAALTAPWLLVTGGLALWALEGAWSRWRSGRLDAAEALIAVGWATLPGGAVWLLLARGDVDTGYGGLVTLLTAAHFHYAGSFVAIWAGLLGRMARPRGLAALGVALVAGFWGVAVGIALSQGPAGGAIVETVAVVVLAIAAGGAGIAGIVKAGRFEDRVAGLMVAVSGGALALSMALALWFHLGAGRGGPDIGWMVDRHGWLNAFGFGLWGALGWRRLKPRPFP